jgi:hypothetical protein
MMEDPAVEGTDIEIFRKAAAQKSQGRDWGFGSRYEDSLSIARPSCSNSVVTNEPLGERNAEVRQLLAEQSTQYTAELEKRDQIIGNYETRFQVMAREAADKQFELQNQITNLYMLIGVQRPNHQVKKTLFLKENGKH